MSVMGEAMRLFQEANLLLNNRVRDNHNGKVGVVTKVWLEYEMVTATIAFDDGSTETYWNDSVLYEIAKVEE